MAVCHHVALLALMAALSLGIDASRTGRAESSERGAGVACEAAGPSALRLVRAAPSDGMARAAKRPRKPGAEFRDCDGCPLMVVLPAGTFLMGSPASEPQRRDDESPRHRVTIPAAFAVSKFEITGYWFAEFVRETGHETANACWTIEAPTISDEGAERRSERSWQVPGFYQTGSQPAVCVTWHDAKAYAAWLSAKTGETYRLLSEAEWEYAARAGSVDRFHFGADEEKLCTYANIADSASPFPWRYGECRDYVPDRTAEAGRFGENQFGLHDMHGNVWEWVQDCYRESYAGAPADGSAREIADCPERVVRGGAWSSRLGTLRAAARAGIAHGRPDSSIGFRVAKTLE